MEPFQYRGGAFQHRQGISIPSYKDDDPDYRYKMPRLETKKEGGGNGKKTRIVNMGDVARALQRPPAYPMKFFGYELGARSSYTEKQSEGEHAIVYGWHETSALQGLLDEFIEKYVLCPGCKLPEIDLVAKQKSQDLKAGCKACRWRGHLDAAHKLTGYILKNPPATGEVGFDAGGKKEKLPGEEGQRGERVLRKKKETEEAKKERDDTNGEGGKEEEEEEANESENVPPHGGDSNVIRERKTERMETKTTDRGRPEGKGTRKKRDHQEKPEHATSEKVVVAKDGKKRPGGESTRKKPSKEVTMSSAAQRRQDAKEAEEDEGEDSDSAGGGRAGLQELIKKLAVFKEGRTLVSRCPMEDFIEEVRLQQISNGFSNATRLYVVLEVLFPRGSLSPKGVELNAGVLRKLTLTAGGTPMAFPDWIGAFDAYVARNEEAAGKRFAMTMKALYDADLAEEEEILGHYRAEKHAPGFAIARKAVAPLLNWLETADAEDDESEDEEQQG